MILGDFNEDYLLNERPVTTSLQSLGFTHIVSEPTHIRGVCLDHIYIRNNQKASQILMCYLIVYIFLTMIQLFYTIKIGWLLFYLKKLVLVLKRRQNDKLLFFAFLLYRQNKLKTNCILFFTEIMDSFSPKKGAATSSKGKKCLLFSSLFL